MSIPNKILPRIALARPIPPQANRRLSIASKIHHRAPINPRRLPPLDRRLRWIACESRPRTPHRVAQRLLLARGAGEIVRREDDWDFGRVVGALGGDGPAVVGKGGQALVGECCVEEVAVGGYVAG